MILSFVISRLKELSNYEVNAIWLQTNDFYYQLDEMQSDRITTDSTYIKIDSSCYDNDIARYVMNKYIYTQAENWRNDKFKQLLGHF